MAAHRYWRVVGIDTYAGGDLELSALHLYDGLTRVDTSATLSASIAPATGSVGNLQDTDTGTGARWAAVAVRAGGWALVWDCLAAVNVSWLRLGGGSTKGLFARDLTLESSDDGVTWSDARMALGLGYPGAGAMTAVYAPSDILRFSFTGAPGSAVVADDLGRPVSSYGGAQIGSDNSLSLSGSGAYLQIANSDDLSLTGDFEIGYRAKLPSGSGGGIYHQGFYDTGSTSWPSPGISIRAMGSFIRFYFWESAASSTERYVDASFTAGVWQTWKMSRVADVGTVTCDGVTVGTLTGLPVLPVPTRPVKIGRWDFSATNIDLTGSLDDLYVSKGGRIAAVVRAGPSSRVLVVARNPSDMAPGSTGVRALVPPALARDVEFGGRSAVVGVVKEKGSPNKPVRRRVRLLRDRDALLVRETWSDAVTGAFAFPDLDASQTYTAYAQDHTGNYRAVIADRITPEVTA